jgi:acid phosphatase class B
MRENMLVSFDFDETICYSILDEIYPNLDSIKKIIKHYNSGDELIIVTSRRESEENDSFIRMVLKDFSIDHIFKKIYMVGGIKARHLKDLGVSLHYDDREEECRAASLLGIKTINVHE